MYGSDSYETVSSVVNDILNRYLTPEYFDENLELDTDDESVPCELCGGSKHFRTIDVDGTNLIERAVCENCGVGYPETSISE